MLEPSQATHGNSLALAFPLARAAFVWLLAEEGRRFAGRLTFNAAITETGTQSYRPAHAKAAKDS